MRKRVIQAAIAVALSALALVGPSSAPSSAEEALTGAALQQHCADAATAMPTVKSAVMVGRGNPSRQMVSMNVYGDPLLMACRALFEQVVIGKILMKSGTEKRPLKIAEKQLRFQADPFVPESVFRMPSGHKGWPKKWLYRCTPGPRKTKIYGVISRELVEISSGRTLARKVSKVPFKIRGGAC